MASHRLNAASSRSHCLFTIHIESSPLASPNEIIASKLTLVDLAGSERGSATGATEGGLGMMHARLRKVRSSNCVKRSASKLTVLDHPG